MTALTVKTKVKNFLLRHFVFDARAVINDTDSLLGKGIIDSTGVLELVAFLEGEFKIKIEDEELLPDNLDSLDKITAYIERKKNHADS